MADRRTIAVAGATGAQGGGLVRAILEADGDFAARAITRSPGSDKARALAAQGVEVVRGDADDPASLDAALAGEIPSGEVMAAGLTEALGEPVTFRNVPFLQARDPELARALYPPTRTCAAWLRDHAGRVPIA